MKFRARVEFKLQDFWIGVFWKRSESKWIREEDQNENAIWRSRKSDRIDAWICLMPCIPIHVVAVWNNRLLTEQETLDDMVAF